MSREAKKIIRGYEFGGGVVGRDSIYVEREIDMELVTLLGRRRDLFVVTAPRQSGKSSLISRVLKKLDEAGHRTCYIDLSIAIGSPDEAHTNTKASDWYRLLFQSIASGLHLDSMRVLEWMEERKKSTWPTQIIDFFSTFCRSAVTGPLLIAIDEVDLVSSFGYHTDSLFEALRSLASEKKADVSFLLTSVNHPLDLMKIPRSFNVHKSYALRDFQADRATVSKWSSGLPWPETVRQTVGREIIRQTGGQPYLTSYFFKRALDERAKTEKSIRALAAKIAAEKHSPQLRAHFIGPQQIVLHDQTLAWEALDLYGKSLEAPASSAAARRPIVNLLVNSGLVRESDERIYPKCPIYIQAFDKGWIEQRKAEIGATSYRSKASAFIRKESRDTICVINTGGMISMDLKPDGDISPPRDLQEFFNDLPEMQEIARVESLSLMIKDSSNMAPPDWKEVAQAIYQRRNRGYSGFVVCHGTDTLAYTASAVAFALGPGLKKPIVFTAAQAPRHVLHGDARTNILRACKVATLKIPEVVVCIGDHVYRAVRAEKKDDYRFDAFHSPTMPPLATMAENIEVHRERVRVPTKRGMQCLADFSEGVFKITFYPGLNPTFLMQILENRTLSGLIIETPGIGVLPTEAPYSLMDLVEQAIEKSIPVLLVGQYPIQEQLLIRYEFATPPIQAGAIPAVNMSAPAAVTKFMWVIPQVLRKIKMGEISAKDKLKEIRKSMNEDMIGEVRTGPYALRKQALQQ